MTAFFDFLGQLNGIIWHDYVLYIVLGVGVLFTVWSGFCQYRALTHGVAVVRGDYDDADAPGAINHFQALSTALSATVGLGNIGGVAVAIALGGPGAVFWMWMIGLAGMALKMTEVCLSMLYRNTDDPENPHGGPMYVAKQGFADMGMARVGQVVGSIFVFTLLISAVTGGNMFQAWNVGEVTSTYFGVPEVATGIILAVTVGMVIIGGIKRIGQITSRLVPGMCLLYLMAAFYVIGVNIGEVPEVLGLIVESAFSATEAEGAFLGGTAGYALLWGMKRALFSSEAGQGSSPIAHSAAKTDEPVREAVVAGLEPFIDTLVVCTLTSLVILSSGIWNRGVEIPFAPGTQIVAGESANTWTLASTPVSEDMTGDAVFTIVKAGENTTTGNKNHQLSGTIVEVDGGGKAIKWGSFKSETKPTLGAEGAFHVYAGASLTAKAFDRTKEGLGKWLITLAAWLFAISTIISWSYYGEQGVVYLLGEKSVLPYKLIYCFLSFVACMGFIKTDAELDALTALGTGVMLWANIPIMLIFGAVAMKAYHGYFKRMKEGATTGAKKDGAKKDGAKRDGDASEEAESSAS